MTPPRLSPNHNPLIMYGSPEHLDPTQELEDYDFGEGGLMDSPAVVEDDEDHAKDHAAIPPPLGHGRLQRMDAMNAEILNDFLRRQSVRPSSSSSEDPLSVSPSCSNPRPGQSPHIKATSTSQDDL